MTESIEAVRAQAEKLSEEMRWVRTAIQARTKELVGSRNDALISTLEGLIKEFGVVYDKLEKLNKGGDNA